MLFIMFFFKTVEGQEVYGRIPFNPIYPFEHWKEIGFPDMPIMTLEHQLTDDEIEIMQGGSRAFIFNVGIIF